MKLSMHILDAWLRDHSCSTDSYIIGGQLCLAGARFCHESQNPNYVYLTKASRIRPGYQPPDCPALINGDDSIILPGQTADRIVDLVMEAFEFYIAWEHSLLIKIMSETTLQDLLDLAHLVIERPMNICNIRGWIYAITDSYGDYVHPHWKNYISRDTSYELNNDLSVEMKNRPVNRQGLPAMAYSQAYRGKVLYADIIVKGERIGEIMAYENNRPFTEKDLQIMQIFQQVVTAYAKNDPGILRSRSMLSEYFQDMLAQKSLEDYNLHQIITLSGWQIDDTFIVLCAQAKKSSQTNTIGRLCDDLEDSIAGVQAFPYDNLAVAIINLSRQKNLELLIQELLKTIPKRSFCWGLSHEFTGLESFLDYYQQAVYAMKHAVRYRLSYSTMRNTAIGCLREGLMQNPWLRTVLHPDFLTLIQYDMKNNSQYASSLYWYLFYSGNYTDAANQLNLHRNTLIYRINRIQEMIHFKLDSINERELYILSYLLYQYDMSSMNKKPE